MVFFDYEKMLIDQSNSKIDSWAIRWQATAYLNNKLTLYPYHSLTENIGFNNNGTHTKTYNKVYKPTSFPNKPINVIYQAPIVNESTIKLIEETHEIICRPSFNLKQRIKKLIPASVISLIKYVFNQKKNQRKEVEWHSGFKNWAEALSKSTGYNNIEILNKVKEATLKVKRGEAVYERDSVIFDKIQYSWPLLAILLKIINDNNNKLNVVDYGGALGSTYFQNKSFFDGVNLKWNIVEQNQFVEIGKREIEDEVLKFYYNIDNLLIENSPDILILSSVLQYLEDPFKVLKQLFEFKFKYILVDKTTFVDFFSDVLTVQVVPEHIYKASYPAWFFNYERFILYFSNIYDLEIEFDSYDGYEIDLNGRRAIYKGCLFKRKD